MTADNRISGGTKKVSSSNTGTKAVNPESEKTTPPTQADTDIDQKDSARPRARNQDALPGILGKQLRAAYGELLNSPVPDQFTELIKRLESKEAAAADDPPTEENGQ
jgi:anti-sigma factor NepR-like protein